MVTGQAGVNGQIALTSALGEEEHAKGAVQILLQNTVEMIAQGKQVKLKTAICTRSQVSLKDMLKFIKTEDTAINMMHIEFVYDHF